MKKEIYLTLVFVLLSSTIIYAQEGYVNVIVQGGGSKDYFCPTIWSCNTWEQCINSTQSRTCIDVNNCGITISKPITTRNCIEGYQTQQPGSYPYAEIQQPSPIQFKLTTSKTFTINLILLYIIIILSISFWFYGKYRQKKKEEKQKIAKIKRKKTKIKRKKKRSSKKRHKK